MEESTEQRPYRSLVLPVLCALQGHPAAGSSWADKVEQILMTELGFTSTTHDTCLYIGNYVGHYVLICRQLDDFIAAGEEEDKLRKLFTHLATKINIVAEIGLVSHYNGTGVVQDSDYVKVHVGKYIENILSNHRWEQRTKSESHLIELLHPSAFKELEESICPSRSWNAQQGSRTALG
jgi:hypothetical protein